MRDDPTLDDRLFFARLRSKLLAPGDVVEAVYRGSEPALARLVGLPAIWVVVGQRAGIAELVPHVPHDADARTHEMRHVLLSDFGAVTKIATVGTRLH